MTRRWTSQLILALLISHGLLSRLAFQAAGQCVVLLDEDASPCAIFQALSAVLPAHSHGRPWSIVLRQTPLRSEALPVKPAPLPGAGVRVDAFATHMPLAWDSAQLAPEAHRLFNTLAEVLYDAVMADKVVLSEGHTDRAGSDTDKRCLSYRRAVAVQRSLHDASSLPLDRLPMLGKGKADLYEPAQPFISVLDGSSV